MNSFNFGKKRTIEMKDNLLLLKKCINKLNELSNIDEKEQTALRKRICKDLINEISNYMNQDLLPIHKSKKVILNSILIQLEELKNSNEDNIFNKIEDKFQNYNDLGGSVYVFRHCDKIKRNFRGKIYDGIPTSSIKNQALKVANEIKKEILISPKKVKLIIKVSEVERTRIFSEIILRKALEINQSLNEDKVILENQTIDDRIRFDIFNETSINEFISLMSNQSKTEFEIFEMWREGKVNSFPKFNNVVKNIQSILDEGHDTINENNDFYSICLYFSHSIILDAYLNFKFGSHHNSIISTASFFKEECNSIYYLNKWEDF